MTLSNVFATPKRYFAKQVRLALSGSISHAGSERQFEKLVAVQATSFRGQPTGMGEADRDTHCSGCRST